MSDWKYSPNLDPVIFGPVPSSEERILGQARPQQIQSTSLNLSTSTPLTDYLYLFFRPKVFFKALFSQKHDFDAWIWAKAILFGMIAIWASQLNAQTSAFEQFANFLNHQVDPKWIFFAQQKTGIIKIAEKIKVLAFLGMQFQAMIAPLLKIGEVLMGSAFLAVGLRWVGIDWKRIHLPSLILFFSYLQIFHFLDLIPVVGGVLSLLAFLVYGIIALKSVFELSTWNSIKAHFIVSYFIANMIAFLALVPLMIAIALFL